jgi:hypothetical protein
MKAPKKSQTPKQKTPKQKAAAAPHAKALEAVATAETVRAHNTKAAASHDAAIDSAEELLLQLAADQALGIQAAPEPLCGTAASAAVPAANKTVWQKIKDWFYYQGE